MPGSWRVDHRNPVQFAFCPFLVRFGTSWCQVNFHRIGAETIDLALQLTKLSLLPAVQLVRRGFGVFLKGT